MYASFLLQTLVVALASASPIASQDSPYKVVKTTTNSNGQVIDWIVPESQGSIASPPPAHLVGRDVTGLKLADVINHDDEAGPAGTVPVLRTHAPLANKVANPLLVRTTPSASASSSEGQQQKEKRGSEAHYYANSAQLVNTHGGGADFSMFNPYVASDDQFSLIQTAVARSGVQHKTYGSILQTVEAGWQHYHDLVNSNKAFLFTFFNTNGYKQQGDNQAGYNQQVKGWVQYDKTVHPGYFFSPGSTIGGDQHDLNIKYYLYQSNWWLYVGGTAIGYYPGSLFSAPVSSGGSLKDYSDSIAFYGEITTSTGPTPTDMGSGNYPEKGYGQAGYIKNINYIDTSDKSVAYNTNRYNADTDKGYKIAPFFNSGKEGWGSYMYLGGPGSDGKVGAP